MQEKLKQLIPKKIRSKFTNRPVLQKIVKNVGWLSFDKFFQLILSITIGIWLARYLGPSDYGLMSFAIAFSVLFGPIIGLGTNGLLVKELVENENKKNIIMGSCFFINLVTGIFAFILLNLVSYFLNFNNFLVFLVIFIYSLNFLLAPFGVIAAYFNSILESKVGVISYDASIIFSTILKIILIFLEFPLIFFILVGLIETIIGVIITVYFYKKANQNMFNWIIDFSYIKEILKISWPLILSGAMVVLYLKIDQVMIGFLLGNVQVGFYSISVKLSEVFYFLPGIILVSLFPTIVKSKKLTNLVYFSRLEQLFYFMTWLPILIIIPFALFSNQIVEILYGVEFLPAAPALAISIWALIAIFVKTALDNYLISENLTKIVFLNSVVGASSNIILNMLFIPTYGIVGAALATVISYMAATYLSLIWFKKTRPIFWIMLKSFNIISGFKYLKNILGE